MELKKQLYFLISPFLFIISSGAILYAGEDVWKVMNTSQPDLVLEKHLNQQSCLAKKTKEPKQAKTRWQKIKSKKKRLFILACGGTVLGIGVFFIVRRRSSRHDEDKLDKDKEDDEEPSILPYSDKPIREFTANRDYDPTVLDFGKDKYEIYDVPGDGNCWIWAFIPVWLSQTCNSEQTYKAFKSKVELLVNELEKKQNECEACADKIKRTLGYIQNDEEKKQQYFNFLKQEKDLYENKQSKAGEYKSKKDDDRVSDRLWKEFTESQNSYDQFIESHRDIWLDFQSNGEKYEDLFSEEKKRNLNYTIIDDKDMSLLKHSLEELQQKTPKVVAFLKELQGIQGIKKQLQHINKKRKGKLLVGFIRLASQLVQFFNSSPELNKRNKAIKILRNPNEWGDPATDLNSFIAHFQLELIKIADLPSFKAGRKGGPATSVMVYVDSSGACHSKVADFQTLKIKLPYKIYEVKDLLKNVMFLFVNSNHYQYLLRKACIQDI